MAPFHRDRERHPANDSDLVLTWRIDELLTQWPFLSWRRLARLLRDEGHAINHKRVQRLMQHEHRRPGPQATHDHASAQSQGLPYLLRGQAIDRPNQVWAADVTYMPIGTGLSVPGGDHGLGGPRSAVA